jgi:hypothetical protein
MSTAPRYIQTSEIKLENISEITHDKIDSNVFYATLPDKIIKFDLSCVD